MHKVVSRIALSVTGAALLAGALVAAAPASADSARQRPADFGQPATGGFTTVLPTRVFDSRPSHIAAGGTRTFNVQGGSTGVPTSGVAAVALNVTVLASPAAGYVSVYPGTTRTGTTTVSFPAGRQLANAAVVRVASGGQMTIYNGSGKATDAIITVAGYYTSGGTADGSFTPVGPVRVVDSNTTVPTAPAGSGAGSIAAGSYKSYRIAGVNGVSTDARGALVSLTVVSPTTAGYVSLGSGASRPPTSTVNLVPGQTLGTFAAVQLAADGTFSVFNVSGSPIRVVADLAGWFRGTTATTAGRFTSVAPARIFNSRTGVGTAGTPLAAGATRTITVTNTGGVPPTGAGTLALTLTAAGATASGALTVYSGTQPTTSTLTYASGVAVPGFALVPIAADGTVTVFNNGTKPVDIIGDVSGFVRNTDRAVPSVSTSRYIRGAVTPDMTPAQITAATRAIGTSDGGAASTTDPQVVLLQFGAQSAKAGDGTQLGVRLSATDVRLTYAQVVSAVVGYVSGYATARGTGSAVTVAVGTSNDGYKNSDGTPTAYTPQAKGTDWANQVVEPAVTGAANAGVKGVTIVGADDIEAGFDGDIGEVTAWIGAYLLAGPNALINNGAALGCPTAAGQVGRNCQAIAVPGGASHTWNQTDYWKVSGGINPARISVLPQIYRDTDASQWENISLSRTSGGPVLTFAGVLTSVSACAGAPTTDPCSSIAPSDAYAAMTSALASNAATASSTVPAVTDIAIS